MKIVKIGMFIFLPFLLFCTRDIVYSNNSEQNTGSSKISLEIVEEYVDFSEEKKQEEVINGSIDEKDKPNRLLPQTGEQLAVWLSFIGIALWVIVIVLKRVKTRFE